MPAFQTLTPGPDVCMLTIIDKRSPFESLCRTSYYSALFYWMFKEEEGYIKLYPHVQSDPAYFWNYFAWQLCDKDWLVI